MVHDPGSGHPQIASRHTVQRHRINCRYCCRIAFSARDHFRDFAEPCQGKNDEIFAIHKVVFMLTVIPTFVNHLPVDAWQVVMGNASLLERGCDGRH